MHAANVRAIRSTHDDGLMWVRLMHWMIADGEPGLPNVDSLLTGVGLRARGDVTAATPDSPDGIVEAQGGQPHEVIYRLTGRASEPKDFDVDTGAGGRHAGAEFVLTVGSDRYQAQSDGWARDVPTGSRVTVTGRLEVVGEYEWDAFELGESRADWLVKAVATPPDGDDIMLDLVGVSSRFRFARRCPRRFLVARLVGLSSRLRSWVWGRGGGGRSARSSTARRIGPFALG
ncbi:hypothetical protein EV651_10765 [Kribbella sp. VKM Ac-2571]|nr:hypothetical protein EV651_10765 [Kribbella sp. VKM Ac-2571]